MSAAHSPQPDRPFVYNFIPQLRHLMPKTAGLPGVEYLQVATVNVREAQDRGYSQIDGTRYYTVTGPAGGIDAALMGKGNPVRGMSPHAGRRNCFVDELIVNTTQLPLLYGLRQETFGQRGLPSVTVKPIITPVAPTAVATVKGD